MNRYIVTEKIRVWVKMIKLVVNEEKLREIKEKERNERGQSHDQIQNFRFI